MIVQVFGNIIINLLKDVSIKPTITSKIISIFHLLKGPISWVIIFILIRIIYQVAPDQKSSKRVINYGALFTTICFIIGTKIYSIYVTKYASYKALYGGLASIVVLMIWVFFLAYIFTIGMALNFEKDNESDLVQTGKDKK